MYDACEQQIREMEMANLSIEEIVARVERICRKHKVEHLYLFGSYATGTMTATSDIDLIIKGCNDLDELKDEIDRIPTLKRIDLFDYDRCESRFLKEDMEQYGKKIY